MKTLLFCFFLLNLFLFSQATVRLYSVYFNYLSNTTEIRELNEQTGNFSFVYAFDHTYGIPESSVNPYYDDIGKKKKKL